MRMLKGIQQKYSGADLERLLHLYPLKFDLLLQKGELPPADGIYSNGRKYWEHPTIKHLLPSDTHLQNNALEALNRGF